MIKINVLILSNGDLLERKTSSMKQSFSKEELLKELKRQLSKEDFKEIVSKTLHLGIFKEPYLTYMLEGKKTIESRFSKNKIIPYEKIDKNDIVIVKKSGGAVVAFFRVRQVFFFDLEKSSITEIRKKYEKELYVDESFWIEKKDSRYATLIFIEKIQKLKPFSISKKGMQTWIKF